MARRRMSGRQLATELAVSPSWVNYRLTGKQPIDLNDLARIAKALEVTVSNLLPREERLSTVVDLRKADTAYYPVGARHSATRRQREGAGEGVIKPFSRPGAGRQTKSRPPGHPTSALREAA